MSILKTIFITGLAFLLTACSLSDYGKTTTEVFPTEFKDKDGNHLYAFTQVTGSEADSKDVVMQLNAATIFDTSLSNLRNFEGQKNVTEAYQAAFDQFGEVTSAAAQAFIKAYSPTSVLPSATPEEAVPDTTGGGGSD